MGTFDNLKYEENKNKGNSSLGVVGKRIYLVFNQHSLDSAYSSLEKANERLADNKTRFGEQDGMYVVSRVVE